MSDGRLGWARYPLISSRAVSSKDRAGLAILPCRRRVQESAVGLRKWNPHVILEHSIRVRPGVALIGPRADMECAGTVESGRSAVAMCHVTSQASSPLTTRSQLSSEVNSRGFYKD